MHLPTLLILAVLGYIVWRTHRAVRRSTTAQEKALAIRGAAAFWVMGFAFIAALVFLPNRARAFLMLPAFFLAVALGKSWRDTRARLRREKRSEIDLERMKRVG